MVENNVTFGTKLMEAGKKLIATGGEICANDKFVDIDSVAVQVNLDTYDVLMIKRYKGTTTNSVEVEN